MPITKFAVRGCVPILPILTLSVTINLFPKIIICILLPYENSLLLYLAISASCILTEPFFRKL